jgi:hypothetical protein
VKQEKTKRRRWLQKAQRGRWLQTGGEGNRKIWCEGNIETSKKKMMKRNKNRSRKGKKEKRKANRLQRN